MPNKVKYIFSLITRFIFTLLFLLLVGLIIVKINYLDEKTMLKKLDNINYYQKLSKTVENQMQNYLIPAGLDKDILNNITDEKTIKKDVTLAIKNFYNNKKITIDEKYFEETLNSNIDKFLTDKEVEVKDRTSLNKFVSQMKGIYKDEVLIFNTLEKFRPTFNKVIKLINILIIALIIIEIVLFIIINRLFKSMVLATTCFTTAISYLLSTSYITNRIDIKNITIFGSPISDLIRELLNSLVNVLKSTSLILLVAGLIFCIINFIIDKNKESDKKRVFNKK